MGDTPTFTKVVSPTHFKPTESVRFYYALLAMTALMSMTFATTTVCATQANLSALGMRRSRGAALRVQPAHGRFPRQLAMRIGVDGGCDALRPFRVQGRFRRPLARARPGAAARVPYRQCARHAHRIVAEAHFRRENRHHHRAVVRALDIQWTVRHRRNATEPTRTHATPPDSPSSIPPSRSRTCSTTCSTTIPTPRPYARRAFSSQ